jgi:hypothetical protein
MPILLFTLLFVVLLLMIAAPVLLVWMFAEPAQDVDLPPRTRFVSFHDGRIWRTFQGWFGNRPLQLVYRRDDRGRFRRVP